MLFWTFISCLSCSPPPLSPFLAFSRWVLYVLCLLQFPNSFYFPSLLLLCSSHLSSSFYCISSPISVFSPSHFCPLVSFPTSYLLLLRLYRVSCLTPIRLISVFHLFLFLHLPPSPSFPSSSFASSSSPSPPCCLSQYSRLSSRVRPSFNNASYIIAHGLRLWVASRSFLEPFSSWRYIHKLSSSGSNESSRSHHLRHHLRHNRCCPSTHSSSIRTSQETLITDHVTFALRPQRGSFVPPPPTVYVQ